jgi:ABC-type multidrug transport system ATPase subunit
LRRTPNYSDHSITVLEGKNVSTVTTGLDGNIAIKVENLTKKYESLAVNRINFTVKRGEVFALLGPNGAGKTTTTEMLVGLRKPTSGKAYALGSDASKDQSEE